MHTDYRLIAILRNVDPQYVLPIVSALMEEGIRCLEVSLSEAERGFGCLERIRQNCPKDALRLGAGTVSRREEVVRLKELDVPFFVTPGFDPEVVDCGRELGIDVLPGVLTPSDVQQAKNRGLRLLKLFPANAFPLHYIASLKGPFPDVEFLAVGGVRADNVKDFAGAGFYGVGVGGNLVPQNATLADIPKIREAAAAMVRAGAAFEKQGE